ncbi:acid resistance repetitive basic protein Asr [Yersinia enterocolitica]|uniref:acid resistance repetitive basic protein Asr n=1 Tax=Yersinia enterocolitica TaxID=630 RepID=UPI0032FC121B|nr:acid resistance repetitive basic protein Asr [Yersinia enterocolitica]HDL7501950.1 acid resistance repetitive basic protein Asr [Yersinia enterocolitica]
MKTVLALIVAATLGMSSIAFAADTVAPAAAPMATAPAAHSAPAKNMHHKKTTHTKSAPAAVPAAK